MLATASTRRPSMWYLSSQNRALRDQEVADLVAAVVEDQRAPVLMGPEPRVGVLVQVGAVEVAQPVLVAREVGRHPVEDHADAALVQRVDQVHEVLRRRRSGWSGRSSRPSDSPNCRRTDARRSAAARRACSPGGGRSRRAGRPVRGRSASGRPRRAARSRGGLRRWPSRRRARGPGRGGPSSRRRPTA